ncbi:MAG: phosphate/phosphite/phosphonate ABC transporter substrate-binding protein [Gammaproteobacteria bacterium]
MPFSSLSQAELQSPIYSIGVVPQFETRQMQVIWKPIISELEQRTGFKFDLQGSPNIPEFEKEFISGKFDFAYMNPYHILIAASSQGYIPILRDHSRQLNGVLVVRKDSGIKDVKQLDGKVLAFPSPNALGASLLMRADLFDKFHIQIQPRYVKTHDSVYLNVVLGQASAGGGVSKSLNQQPTQIYDALRIIYKTQGIAPHPFTVHPRVAKSVRQEVYKAFIAMGKSETAKAKLAKIPIMQLGPAQLTDYQSLANMKLERFYNLE